MVPDTDAPLGTTTVLPTMIGLASDASNFCVAFSPVVIGEVVRTLRSVPAGITTGVGVGVGVGGATVGVSLAADSVGVADSAGGVALCACDFGAEYGATGGALLCAGGCCEAVVSGEEVAVGWGEAASCFSLAL
jgi:hypothetical protein